MFCSNCGCKLNNNPNFCSNCGAELSKYQQDNTSQFPTPHPIYKKKPPPLWQKEFSLGTPISKKANRLPSRPTLSAGNQSTKLKEGNMIKFVWLVIFSVVVVIQATDESFSGALGFTTGSFLVGMLFSPIWWIFTKRGRPTPWQWFDWLNAGAYTMAGLLILRMVLDNWIRTQVGG